MTSQQTPVAYYATNLESWTASCEFYGRELTETLRSAVPLVEVSVRVKELASFVAKVRRGDKPRTPADVRDVVGARVVCSSLRDAEAILTALQASPLAVSEVDRIAPEVESLGYAGIHCFVNGSGLTSAPDGIVAGELQIRTRAQDAWSVVSHSAIYKPHTGGAAPSVGEALRRRVNRLSAIVEIFDDEVNQVYEMRADDPALRGLVAAERIGALYDDLFEQPRRFHTLSATMDELLHSYRDGENAFDLVKKYLAENAEALRTAIESKSPGSDAYVDNDDWLLLLPEALVIAERASTARQMLAEVARHTAFEGSIRSVSATFGFPLPAAA